ncbi:hypothetical protein J3E69DRAFT_357264 [Trichoderma sp. SZMC 28015]
MRKIAPGRAAQACKQARKRLKFAAGLLHRLLRNDESTSCSSLLFTVAVHCVAWLLRLKKGDNLLTVQRSWDKACAKTWPHRGSVSNHLRAASSQSNLRCHAHHCRHHPETMTLCALTLPDQTPSSLEYSCTVQSSFSIANLNLVVPWYNRSDVLYRFHLPLLPSPYPPPSSTSTP